MPSSTGDLLELKADLLRALGQRTRLRILEALGSGEQCVGEICRQIQQDQPTVSRHLCLLRRSGLLVARKQGLKVVYRIADEGVMHILGEVQVVLDRQLRHWPSPDRVPA
jgi:ArsR family transcriptional regulator